MERLGTFPDARANRHVSYVAAVSHKQMIVLVSKLAGRKLGTLFIDDVQRAERIPSGVNLVHNLAL